MTRVYSNNFSTTLSASITNSATSISITSATGFPTLAGSDYAIITIDDGTNKEIIKVTALTGTTLTVVRAQEGTTGTAFASGADVEIRATAGSFSDKLDYVAPGTSGNVLTSNGTVWTSAAPSGGGGGSGSLVLIETKNFSGSSIGNFTTGFNETTYIGYKFVLSNLTGSSSEIYVRFSTDGGSTWLNTTYTQIGTTQNSSAPSTVSGWGGETDGQVNLNAGNGGSGYWGGFIECTQFNTTTPLLNFDITVKGSGTSFRRTVGSAARVMSSSPVNAVQIAYSTGTNFSTGTISLYGYVK